jgi:hypothetical protein
MSKMVVTGYSVVSKQYHQREETTSLRVVGRFKCKRCERNADKECSLRVSNSEVSTGQSSSIVTKRIQELAPPCTCDMMRCRIGTAYMRRHRLALKGERI